jgi:hypothetical protein
MQKTKGDRVLTAECELWSHEFGWELRLIIDGHGMQMTYNFDSAIAPVAQQDRASFLRRASSAHTAREPVVCR